MAGSRVEKYSTIFKRFTGLIDSGAVVYELRPLWYDVYKRFPPKVEPLAIRPEPKVSVKPIFYQEDILRAKFYRIYGNGNIIHNFFTPTQKLNACDLFIEKHIEMSQSEPNVDVDADSFIQKVEKSLNDDCGLKLQRVSKKKN